MSKKKILQGMIAGMAAVSIINVGSVKDVKADTVPTDVPCQTLMESYLLLIDLFDFSNFSRKERCSPSIPSL